MKEDARTYYGLSQRSFDSHSTNKYSSHPLGSAARPGGPSARLEALGAYKARRKNSHLSYFEPNTPFPEDGKYSWEPAASGQSFKIRYDEGHKDQEWMEKCHRNHIAKPKRNGPPNEIEKRDLAKHPYLRGIEEYQQGNFTQAIQTHAHWLAKTPDFREEQITTRDFDKSSFSANYGDEPSRILFSQISPYEKLLQLYQFFTGKNTTPHPLLLFRTFSLAENVIDAKLAYTLGCLALDYGESDKHQVREAIYYGLDRIASHHIHTSDCIAIFKGILRSAKRKKIINQGAFDRLDNVAVLRGVESSQFIQDLNKRVTRLEKQYKQLGDQVRQNSENISKIHTDLSNLRDALRIQARRKMAFGTAQILMNTVTLGVFGGVANAMEGAINLTEFVNLSDIRELGCAIMRYDDPEKFDAFFSKQYGEGKETLIETIRDEAGEKILTMAGLHPDEFVELWYQQKRVSLDGGNNLGVFSLATTMSQRIFAPPRNPRNTDAPAGFHFSLLFNTQTVAFTLVALLALYFANQHLQLLERESIPGLGR